LRQCGINLLDGGYVRGLAAYSTSATDILTGTF
jgi:hypothetical protein